MQIKNSLLTIVFLVTITCLHAQRSSTSPYSRFGYGLLNENSLALGQSMSNTGIAIRSNNHLNFLNPASFSAIDSSHFIFEFGVKHQVTQLSINGESAKRSNSNMEYMAMGFPVTRWWGMGVALLPYSKTGYSFVQKQTLADSGSTSVNNYYEGSGGTSQIVWANSFKLLKGLSIGINSGFIFGEITRQAKNEFSVKTLSDYTLKNDIIEIHGLYFETGIQYEYKLNAKKSLVFAALFAPDQIIKSKKQSAVASYTSSGGSISNVYENNYYEIQNNDLPMKIAAGLGFQQKDKLLLGIDFKYQDWTNAKIYGVASKNFQKMYSLNVGTELLPNKFAAHGYFNRVRYRLGARVTQTNLAMSEKETDSKLYSVNEASVSLGFGFPLKMSANNVNLSFEYGTRGTSNVTLPHETFFIINLNFTLNENWFNKYKIK